MVIFVNGKLDISNMSWQMYLLMICRRENPTKIIQYEDEFFEAWLAKKSVKQVLNMLKDYENK